MVSSVGPATESERFLPREIAASFVFVLPFAKQDELDYQLELSSNLISNDWKNSGYPVLPILGSIDPEFIRLVIEAL